MRSCFFLIAILLITLELESSQPTENFIEQNPVCIVVKISNQTITLYNNSTPIGSYIISTGKNGAGQLQGSLQTPLGIHRIKQKLGRYAPTGTIFHKLGIGGTWTPKDKDEYKNEDLLLSRVLKLEGLEIGFNSGNNPEGKNVDSLKRGIAIHGTNHEDLLGKANSHGCIRMSSKDVIDLYNRVKEGTIVKIIM